MLKFERESGVELSKDLNVLVKVRAKFDPQYGFSVNVEDINSSYTLGDIARCYQQVLERLTSEGLLNKNKLDCGLLKIDSGGLCALHAYSLPVS